MKPKRVVGTFVSILLMILLLTGCMVFDVSLTIEEGGSGELVYDVLWEPQYGENSEESIPEGTEYIPAVTVDGVSYTGYRVRREFSGPEELKSILTEQAGMEEVFGPETDETGSAVDIGTGEAAGATESGNETDDLLTQARAFKLGNFISNVDYQDDTATQRCTLELTFTPIDLAGMVGTNADGAASMTNEDIFTLYFSIDMPGDILSAQGSLESVEVEYDGDKASFRFSPDSVEDTVITLESDYSNNTYIYADQPVPDESYTYSGDSEANKALDKATAEKYGLSSNMADSLDYVVLYLVGAAIVVIAIVLICVIRLRGSGRSGDRAYDRKLERDLRNEEARASQKPVKATRNKKNGKK